VKRKHAMACGMKHKLQSRAVCLIAAADTTNN